MNIYKWEVRRNVKLFPFEDLNCLNYTVPNLTDRILEVSESILDYFPFKYSQQILAKMMATLPATWDMYDMLQAVLQVCLT